ncbi:class I SAM-dependent methyltransferase [Sediminibacillus albus]|uniref:Methyltransferase domain-containing protein n=1 Tax=Sediminibacillus albus TaxID=407036 RepID=A0A1G8WXT9_9BACI|nr:class I SAM-dependent methyltransferase [Sediminibacillus albus]SDJ83202.1 Methyltransferase domain-containing protein [Sediminibacillus albus]
MVNNSAKTDVQLQFGNNAANYVTSTVHAKGEDLAKLVKLLHWNGEETVLDIATGGGHVANALAPLSKKITAIDLTKEILAASKKFIESNGHSNVEFLEADAENLPFPAETFDIAVCRIAAHHFADIESFVREAFRALKKGGIFLFIDNTAPEDDEFDEFYNRIEKKRDYSHQRAWKKSEWVRLIEQQGFELEEMHCLKKSFSFDNWCNTMALPEAEKQQLAKEMLQAPAHYQQKFKITQKAGKVNSFQGESVLIKAAKPIQ